MIRAADDYKSIAANLQRLSEHPLDKRLILNYIDDVLEYANGCSTTDDAILCIINKLNDMRDMVADNYADS